MLRISVAVCKKQNLLAPWRRLPPSLAPVVVLGDEASDGGGYIWSDSLPPPDAMLRLWSVGPYHRTKTGGKEEEEEEEEEGRFRNDDDDDGEDEWGEMEQR